MVDLLASNKEASKAFLDVCDKLAAKGKISQCKDGLSSELLEIVVDIEDKNTQIDGLIYSLNATVDMLTGLKTRFELCQKCTVESNLTILDEKLNKITTLSK